MIGLISTLISGGVTLYRQRQDNKAKVQERKDRISEAKTVSTIRRIEQGDTNAAKLDEMSIAQRGWKDEYLLIITTAPLILSFVPDYAKYIALGFDALNTIPDYYWYGLGMVYVDTFGFRRMARVAVERWLEKRFGSG
ncbi:hypothetical protein [Photobacterium chitinilyticum]|uniref:TMhelix containing protein n=1 Tax=Photobacterium chitinilyticum TaxID=2485123 RepID=A0A444JPG7_9GAMM|nr:hypothetical protein [Photobacterium chitinilyticum]RWX54984.1 hypothetical protein EDI28_14710 [Photobacterium chitinilyticum]